MSTAVAFMEEWRDLMRSWGFTVHEAAGWRTRDAQPASRYDPTGMFLEHHDASSLLSGNWGALAYVTQKRLAQIVHARDGQITIVAAGVTHHAGVGGPFLDIPANGANTKSVATEVANSGSERYDPRLTRSIIAAEKAWCVVAGRGADRVRGHKEWATPKGRKQDPSIDMNARRADVAAFATTAGEDWFDMATPQELEAIVLKVVRGEGLSGAGDAPLMLKRGYEKAIRDQVTAVLRSEGVSGAGDVSRIVAAIRAELPAEGGAGYSLADVEAATERAVRKVAADASA